MQSANELRDSKIKVNTIHPGYAKTDMTRGRRDRGPGRRQDQRRPALIDDAGPNGSYRYLTTSFPGEERRSVQTEHGKRPARNARVNGVDHEQQSENRAGDRRNRGIGLETVRQLASAACIRCWPGATWPKAREAAQALKSEGLPVEAIALDVSDAASIAAAAKQVEDSHGRLDILVNNAGIFKDDFAKPPSEQNLEIWRETFDTNCSAWWP